MRRTRRAGRGRWWPSTATATPTWRPGAASGCRSRTGNSRRGGPRRCWRVWPARGRSSPTARASRRTRNCWTRCRPGIVLRGNGAAALRCCADPLELAAALDRIGAPHPEVRAAPPAEPAGWLGKRAGRSGGAHVRPAAAADRARPGLRWQRRAEGEAWSALFLAAGGEARVLGCCRLLPAAAGAPPYAWSGAVGPLPAPAGVAEQVQWLAPGARPGAGSQRRQRHGFPHRPGAAGAAAGPEPALDRHLRTVRRAPAGRLPAGASGGLRRPPAGGDAAGRWRRRAAGGCTRPRRLAAARTERDWPPEAADRPRPGAPVAAGEPLCTVRGRWSDYAAARAGLRRSGARVLAALGAAPAGSEAHV